MTDASRVSDAPTILIIEDEPNARSLLIVTLAQRGYQCLHATTGSEGITSVITYEPSAVLLDLGLPDLDGVEVTTRIRERSAAPIIVISARDKEADKIAALDAGASDYLTKPFAPGELLARIRAALRSSTSNSGQAPAGTVTVGNLSVNFDVRRVTLEGVEVHLSPIEYRLLGVLVQSAGRVVTHQQLLRQVWGARYAGQMNYLRVYMKKLRSKVERDVAQPKYLLNEPGVGYRLRLPE